MPDNNGSPRSAAPEAAFYPTCTEPLEHPHPFDPTYGYDYEQLLKVGSPEGPADLEAFWEQTYREAMAIAPRVTTRAISCERTDVDLFEIEFDSWGGTRIGGWLTLPRTPHNTPVGRGVVVGHGYGGRGGPEFDLPGPPCAAIFPCARGLGTRSLLPGISNLSAGHVLTGVESKQTYIHRGCAADLWCAASALLEVAPEAARALHYMGASFGGGTGAMAVAWDPRLSAAYFSVPSFGNHPLRLGIPCCGSGEAVRQYAQEHPEVLENVLQYFDAATIARHIRVPVLCECALFDPAVPPPGQFAVYNALGGPKELIVRRAGHFSYPEEAAEGQASRAIQEEWFTRLTL